MKRLKHMRYAALAAVLGVCFLSTSLQASGLKGNNGKSKDRVKISIVNWLKTVKQDYYKRDNDWCKPKPPPSVPEPSSLLGGLAAGAGLCGLALYQRRRNRS